jgi:hypothetical protein
MKKCRKTCKQRGGMFGLGSSSKKAEQGSKKWWENKLKDIGLNQSTNDNFLFLLELNNYDFGELTRYLNFAGKVNSFDDLINNNILRINFIAEVNRKAALHPQRSVEEWEGDDYNDEDDNSKKI